MTAVSSSAFALKQLAHTAVSSCEAHCLVALGGEGDTLSLETPETTTLMKDRRTYVFLLIAPVAMYGSVQSPCSHVRESQTDQSLSLRRATSLELRLEIHVSIHLDDEFFHGGSSRIHVDGLGRFLLLGCTSLQVASQEDLALDEEAAPCEVSLDQVEPVVSFHEVPSEDLGHIHAADFQSRACLTYRPCHRS